MSSSRADEPELAESFVMVLGQRRRRSLRGARNLAALGALLGLCVGAESLAAGTTAHVRADWLSESDELGVLAATVLLQVAMVLSGMLSAHGVISRPPRPGVRLLVDRLVGSAGLLLATAAVLGFGGVLAQGPLPVPRLLVGVVAAFQLCSAVLCALLAPMLLRRWAWVVPVLGFAVWMALGLAAGTVQTARPSTAVAASTGLGGLFESETLAVIITLGCCHWAGAVVVCLGHLVDGSAPVVRALVPALAGIGTVIFLPQMLTGASIGHLMLAVALAPLADVAMPGAIADYDIGLPLLTLGWAFGLTGSLLIAGRIDSSWCAACAVALGAPLSILLGRLTT